MKKIIAVILTTVIIITSLSFSFGTSAEETKFSGSKKIVYSIDSSDMNNYFNGGRAAFDILLRAYAPEWLTYSIKSEGLDLAISFEYSFESYNDFCSKTSDLISSAACIEYKKEKSGVFYIEGHTAVEWLSFICSSSTTLTYDDYDFETLFKVKKNETVINGETFSGDKQIVVLPNEGEAIILKSLAISTELNDKGEYTRTIVATAKDYEKQGDLASRFSQVGEVESNEYSTTVVFDAYNQAELIRKTILCLYVPCTLKTNKTQLEGLNIGVVQTEEFGLDVLMSEYSNFSFEFKYPRYYRNVASNVEEIVIEEGVVKSNSKEPVQYYYEREFSFSALDIKTDMSGLFGKVRKSITFIAPITQVKPYHDQIKKKFENYVKKGVALNIYDIDSNRYYEFSYSSWFSDDLFKFAKSILGDSYSLDISDSWLPYGKSTITEGLKSSKVAISSVPLERITLTYVFMSGSKYQCNYSGRNVTIDEENNSLECVRGDNREIIVEYHRLHLLKNILQVVIVVILIVLIIFAVKYVKKIKTKLKEKPKVSEKPKKESKVIEHNKQTSLIHQKKLCPNCGSELPENAVFCGKCGIRLSN